MSEHEPLNEYEQVPSPRELPNGRRQVIGDLLMDEVRHTRRWWQFPALRRLANRSRNALTIGIGALALVLVGGAASAYVAFRPVQDEHSVQCFTSADVDAEHQPPDVSVIGPDQTAGAGPQKVDDPVQQCAQLWRIGVLHSDSATSHDPAPSGSRSRSVPGLVACTLDNGAAGVFPGGTSTCQQLGLPRATR